jgi:hypothetical protein
VDRGSLRSDISIGDTDTISRVRRIPVGLTEAQHQRLRRESVRRRRSVGALIRDAVDQAYPDESDARRDTRVRAVRVFGTFRSGHSDVSERHDEHLARLERW